jgi:molybdenum cofactor guanylyltransferase
VDDISVAVLAGGRSRRFGSDKRLHVIDGVTLLGRTLGLAATLADDVVLVVADAADALRIDEVVRAHHAQHSGLRVVTDTRPAHGPLAGLEAALTAAQHELVLVLAGDHPRLDVALLMLLIDTARAMPDRRVVALEGGLGAEPMLAVYRRGALEQVGAALGGGTRRMVDALATLGPHVIAQAIWRGVDADGAGLIDLDTPEDADTPDVPA